MNRRWMIRAAILAVVLVLPFATCEGDGRGGVESIVGASPVERPSAATVQDAYGGTYRLIEGRMPPLILDLKVSRLIGLGGGSLTLAGHTLTVPAGAVTQPTLFTMTLLPSGYVQVDLSATISGLLGKLLDVGSRGFRKPVQVSLTYAWASNVEDPASLVILRVPERRGEEWEVVGDEVSKSGKTVTAYLDHFSRYCLASN